MSLFTDLRLAFQKIPPRLPRIMLTSILVTLLFLPLFSLALAVDNSGGFSYLRSVSSKRSQDKNGFRAILLSCDESSELCRSGETFTNSIHTLADKYDVSVDGSVIFLNAQPFISSAEYLPFELPTDLSAGGLPGLSELNANNSFGSDLLAQDLPHYGVFRRVISPEYAEFLLQKEQAKQGEADAPETEPASIDSLIGRFYTEAVSIPILVKEDTSPEPSLSRDRLEFTISYQIIGIANTADPILSRVASIKSVGNPIELETTALSSYDQQPDSYIQALATFAKRGLFLYEANPAVQDFTVNAVRIEDLPMVQFNGSSELARFLLAQILANFRHSIGLKYNSAEIVYSPVIVLLSERLFSGYSSRVFAIIFFANPFILLTLVAALLVFLLFCSAQKNFAKRNANTLVLLHALRATNFDRRTISAPLRLLLLICPLALIGLIHYFYHNQILTQIAIMFGSSQIAQAIDFLNLSETHARVEFGVFSLVVTIIYVLAWWLAGLRSRTYNSMKKLSKYTES